MISIATTKIDTVAWVHRGSRPRTLLVGARFVIDGDIMATTAHQIATDLIRTGAGPTLVVDENPDGFTHVAGPVYWLEPAEPSKRGTAECATCGQMSKSYLAPQKHHALGWGRSHRCPRDDR
jgi:hypothetical protein